MPYSFVRLYLFKCNVCLLNFIWIKPKRFLIILYVFESDFYHFLCSYLVLTLFSLINHTLCCKTSVRIFGYSFWLLSWVVHFGYLFWRLALSRDPVASLYIMVLRLISRLASHETPRNSFLKGFSWETCFKLFPFSPKPLY